jgi:hypothetical protein
MTGGMRLSEICEPRRELFAGFRLDWFRRDLTFSALLVFFVLLVIVL